MTTEALLGVCAALILLSYGVIVYGLGYLLNRSDVIQEDPNDSLGPGLVKPRYYVESDRGAILFETDDFEDAQKASSWHKGTVYGRY